MSLQVGSKAFDDKYYYDGNDLGSVYGLAETKFRVWAPTADEVVLVLYSAWNDKEGKHTPMTSAEKGTWTSTVEGDLHNQLYTYKVKFGDKWNEAADPYAKSVSVNGEMSAVIDLSRTNPDHWEPNKKPPFTQVTDAIMYELHVRDLSIHKESGIENKGKFLAFTESDTFGPNGTKTGLNHIKDLGITHIQLLPIYDYATVDEANEEPQFNWGYDPKNYNALEGSYATNPYDPSVRIREFKSAVQGIHDAGLRVTMDVVYNHVFETDTNSLEAIVPGYYFRQDNEGGFADGSFCGNETASDRKMMRKFMIDSIDHWATEYNLDGFRFDLMGLHDVETMNQIRKRLHVIDPTLTLIGEGWKMGHALSVDQRANQDQAEKMPGIAHFNDTIRDGIKGSSMEYDEKGFVNGDGLLAEDVKKGIVGGVNYEGDICLWGETEPCQSVSYTEAHDNHTIYDKIKFTNGTDDEEIVKKMHHMANAIVLTSQGVAFLHAGQEFMRTKDGVENSYKSPDHINWLDWELKERNMKSVEYVKGLINLRKQHPAFRLDSADLVRKHLKFTEAPDKVIAYSLKDNAKDDSWKEIFVAHNAAREPMNVKLPADGEWHVVVKGNQAGTEILDSIKGEEIHVDGLSTVIAYYK